MSLPLMSSAYSSFVALTVFLCFAWNVHMLYCDRWNEKERRNVKIVKHDNYFAAWFPGLYYLFNGPDVLLRNYSSGVPIAVQTPETYYIHFSSDHVQELKDAPDEQLSLHALSNDMFYPDRLMNGLKVKDKMFDNGTIHTRVFRVALRPHLRSLTPALQYMISSTFQEAFSEAMQQGDWKDLSIFSVSKKVITAANAVVFFGPDLASDKRFLDASLTYIEELYKCSEIFRLTPSLIHPLIAPILLRCHNSSQVMVQYLTPVVRERLVRKQAVGNGQSTASEKAPMDCIQLFVDANSRRKEWTAEKIVQVLMGTWFAAVHQPALSLVYTLHDLCDHPEYITLLREEICAPSTSNEPSATEGTIQSLALLDAFIKESCRLNPSDSISVRRKVLKPFTFSDGTHILPGDVACVPLQAIMRDEHLYPDSMSFSPSRFMAKKDHEGASPTEANRFTDAGPTYPLWGLGKHSCPGRFLASLVLKLCIAHIVMNYDMMAPVEKKSRTFYFRSAIIPKTSTSMRFRARQISDLSVMPEGCLTDDVSVNYNMGQDHGPCGRSVWDCSSSFLDL